MTAPLDPDHMPIPILVVRRDGWVTANHAFEDALGRHEATRQLDIRFEIAPWGGRAFRSSDLPWERVLRQDFTEEEIWYDRFTSSRLLYCVRGRSIEQGGVLAFEDLTRHSMRLIEFADAAARSAIGANVDETSIALAREVANVIGADAVFVFVPAQTPDGLKLAATSRSDLSPGVLSAASGAARTHAPYEVDIDSEDVTCAATRALRSAGLRWLVAIPLAIGSETLGSMVVAWHQKGGLRPLERRMLDAMSHACAAALLQVRTRRPEDTESVLLHKLRSAALSIRELTSVHGVLEQLVDQACSLVGARSGALSLLKDAGELADLILVNKSEHFMRASDSREVRAVLESVATNDRSVLRGRSASDRSYLGAQLRIDSRAIGGVCLSDKQDGAAFTETDEHVLELFSAQAALAIGYSRQLERAEAAQRRLASLHDELSAVIAHDMRSPISSILLHLDLLLERGEKRGDHVVVPIPALRRLRDAGRRISRMADDLLDASRIELRRLTLERRRLWLREVIDNLVAQLEPTFGGRPVEIAIAPDVPAVLADPIRLDEIITNLLENAAKYSPPGCPIAITVTRDGTGATLTVEDKGAGISADEMPRLFDRFFQAKKARGTKSGLGLGLYITKGLVEAHGGKIWVDSLPGEGSRFHVWLPSAEAGVDDPGSQAAFIVPRR